ncbi:nucleolar protein 16 isoform X3 [Callithrix jacchus]|uniref:nucleolar protein 16 isoform X3 n=1 Tax=Callithrix jacchus TaxID=9483 RepID=UPI000840590F|nr:nucleolar protein 16 isoform X3 [Callithrix jacchus]
MPKAKGKTRRQKFGYNVNRKRLNRNARRKAAPRIECSHIRHAWDHAKSVRQNLAEMGLAVDPNKAVPLRKRKVKVMEVDIEERPKELVRKPYVLNGGCGSYIPLEHCPALLELGRPLRPGGRSQPSRKERKYSVSGPHRLCTLHGGEPRGGL